MAKSKKKAKSFLPKKIAGVKVPKKVRQGRFGELLASPAGQKLIAEALLAAGAIAAGRKAAASPKVREMVHDARERLTEAADGSARKEEWTPESASYEAAGAEGAAGKQPAAREAGPL